MTTVLHDVVARIDTLPPLPELMLRLIRTVNDPNKNFSDIVDVIRVDQTITTELLRLANSAYFGISNRVKSVEDAVRLLGANKVMQLVLEAQSRALLCPAQAGYGLSPGQLWLHSVAVAIAAGKIAARIKLTGGLAFTLGLLHDIGKIVLNELVAAQYGKIAALAAGEKLAFHEAEQRVLGFTHAEVGALAAERWKLPAEIVNGIRYHLNPSESPAASPLLDVVHLANAVCVVIGVGGGDDGLQYRADQSVADRHGLLEHDFEAIGAEVIAELKAVQEIAAK